MTTLPALLTIPTLLALLARSDADPLCGPDQRPTISATTASKKSYKSTEKIVLDSTYGDPITVSCESSTATDLTILNQDGSLLSKKLNCTTIQQPLSFIVGEHAILCADSNNCSDSLTIAVYPAVAVTASNVHQTLGKYGRPVYFVPRGENYDVFCSAHEVAVLEISSDDKELETKAVNKTTVAAAVKATDGRDYVCSKEGLHKYFKVIVDDNPEARGFGCVLHLNRKLECWWRSSSRRNTFALSILRSSGNILCSDMSGALAGGCARAWNDELDDLYVYSETFTLQLEACNEVFCQKQTFEIQPKKLIKVDPVYNLKVLNSSSRSAELSWRHSNYLCYRNCEYKVKYRLGTQWRQVNLPIECYDLSHDVFCKLQLALPCPNTHYEVRISVKPLSATVDKSWSDAASILFFNTPSRFEEVAPKCGVLMEPEPVAADVLREVRELIDDLNLHVNQKMAEIKALMDKLNVIEL